MKHQNSNRRPQRLAAAGILLLALTACTPSGTDMTPAATTSEPATHDQEGPAYRQNPQPQQAYRITMTIADAPGPFAQMRALAHYDVVNRECLSPPKDNPGGHTAPVPTAPTEVPFERVADSTYTSVVYADQMLDEDYYGYGVCRWQMTGFVVQMKATGAGGETLFAPSYSMERLLAGEPETVYFNKISYPRLKSSSLDEPISLGQADKTRFGPSIQDEDLFTVTFTPSKEATP